MMNSDERPEPLVMVICFNQRARSSRGDELATPHNQLTSPAPLHHSPQLDQGALYIGREGPRVRAQVRHLSWHSLRPSGGGARGAFYVFLNCCSPAWPRSRGPGDPPDSPPCCHSTSLNFTLLYFAPRYVTLHLARGAWRRVDDAPSRLRASAHEFGTRRATRWAPMRCKQDAHPLAGSLANVSAAISLAPPFVSASLCLWPKSRNRAARPPTRSLALPPCNECARAQWIGAQLPPPARLLAATHQPDALLTR